MWVSFPVQAPMGGNQSMILSYTDASLSPFPSSCSLKDNERMSSGEDLTKKKKRKKGWSIHWGPLSYGNGSEKISSSEEPCWHYFIVLFTSWFPNPYFIFCRVDPVENRIAGCQRARYWGHTVRHHAFIPFDFFMVPYLLHSYLNSITYHFALCICSP